ncbi:MAG TPA: hypothetical protein VH419_00540 [Nocardioidaceae bacterium]|jgi:hypothetical protein
MTYYIIRVEGQLSAGLMATFPHLEATQHAQTVLHGHLDKQSELSEVLGYLGEIGVDVVEVHRLPENEDVMPV